MRILNGEVNRAFTRTAAAAAGRARRALALGLGAAIALAACSSGGSTVPIAQASAPPAISIVTGTAVDAVDTPGKVAGTVALPAGSPIALNSLSVRTSVGSAPIAANGTFTVQAFPNGHSLAVVVLPNGDPVLYGFLGTGATTLDATSTAVVFGFFACDAYVLTPDVRAEAPALIAAASGFGTLVNAVASAIATGSDPLKTPNSSLTSAIQAYVASIEAASTSGNASAQRLRDAITISPVGSSTGSGVSLIQEFPSGLHFLNTYRRRAVAEVDRVSYVPSGTTAPVPSPTRLTATPLPIPPVNGVNAGVISAIDDIFQTFFNEPGNPSAYAPVASSSIALPLVGGSSSTTYLVTLLGPGASLGTFLSLNDADTTIQLQTELYYYIVDLAIPFITTVVLPLEANAIDKALATEGGADVISELLSDGGTLVPQLQVDFQPNAQGHIDPLPAINDAMRNLIENPAYTRTLENFFQQAVKLNIGPNSAAALTTSFQTFNKILEGADFGLAAFDATIVGKDLLAANLADQYTVTVVPDKLTLTPSSQTLTGVASGTLTATDLSNTGTGAVPLQYTWTNTAQFGHLTDGIAGHVDSFTTTKNTVTYTSTGSGSGTDTVTVQIGTLQGPRSPSQPIGSPLSATVTVQQPTVAVGAVALTPSCVYFTGVAPGMQQYTASVNLPQGDTLTDYRWSIQYDATVNATLDVPNSSIVSSSNSGSEYSSASNTATLNVGPLLPGQSVYFLQLGVWVLYTTSTNVVKSTAVALANIYGGVGDDCPPGSPNPS